MKKVIIFVLLCIFSVCLAVCFTGCKNNAISVPEGIEFDIENNIKWEAVENARAYTVEVTDVVNKETSEHIVRNKTIYSLSWLPEGDYDIRLKALASSREFSDSAWSKVFNFRKLYETGCLYELINSDTEYSVQKVGNAQGSIEIEDEYRGKPVTRIGANAFRKSSAIEKITLGKNIISVGDSAFYNCINLTTVVLPETLSAIGQGAFQYCKSLKTINIPAGLSYISPNMFTNCYGLESIDLGENVVTIYNGAFQNCTSLTEIEIPDSVTYVGDSAFSGCKILKKVVLGKNLETISQDAFSNCSLKDGIEFNENGNLKTIGNRAFSGCSELTGVDIPDGVEYIGGNAFHSCPLFEHVTIPSSVTSVGAGAFYKTKFYNEAEQAGMQIIYADKWAVGVTLDIKPWIIDIFVAYNEEDTIPKVDSTRQNEDEEIEYLYAVGLRNDTEGIAEYTFYNMDCLRYFSAPDNLRFVNNSCFRSCSSLYRFYAADSVLEEVGSAAFWECSELQSVSFPSKTLVTIGSYCFYYCEKLHNPDNPETLVPSSVRKIGTYAFLRTGLWYDAEEDDENGYVAYAGRWAVGRVAVAQKIVLREDTVGISCYALAESRLSTSGYLQIEGLGLTSIENTSSLRFINDGAFYMCADLRNLPISSTSRVQRIENYTYYGCHSVFTVDFPTNISYIGRSAFYDCGSLGSVDLTECERITEIGDFAFAYCVNLSAVYLSDVVKIGANTFCQCKELTEINLPDSVTSIGDQAFFGCYELSEVNFGQNVEKIGKSAFYQCYTLKEISLPDSLTYIGDNAFYGCSSVTKITLGTNVEYIGDNAFSGIYLVPYIKLSNKVKHIGNNAFYDCESVKSITLSNNSTWIGAHAFFQNDKATIYTDAKDESVFWHGLWNSSRRPVVFGCTLSEDGTYVVSVTITENSFANVNEFALPTPPEREGYTFIGWAKDSNATTADYTAQQLYGLKNGTTVYAVWALNN